MSDLSEIKRITVLLYTLMGLWRLKKQKAMLVQQKYNKKQNKQSQNQLG